MKTKKRKKLEKRAEVLKLVIVEAAKELRAIKEKLSGECFCPTCVFRNMLASGGPPFVMGLGYTGPDDVLDAEEIEHKEK